MRRGRYCRTEGWLCTPGNRCAEHKVTRDPARLADIIRKARGR